MEDFESARDRVMMGQLRDTMVLMDDERKRMAYHESGHALLAYVLEQTDPLHKITIIPRGMALGVTMTLPEEDRHIMARQDLEDSLCMRMGGRVAELLVYGDLSTGAADDLQRNTELAQRMVREWGMSKEIGPMAWGSNNQVFLGEDLMHTRDYSDHTSQGDRRRGGANPARARVARHRGADLAPSRTRSAHEGVARTRDDRRRDRRATDRRSAR